MLDYLFWCEGTRGLGVVLDLVHCNKRWGPGTYGTDKRMREEGDVGERGCCHKAQTHGTAEHKSMHGSTVCTQQGYQI